MSTNNAKIGPKFDYYRAKHDGQVYPALKHPLGYEDNHPEEFEGVDGYNPEKGDDAARERLEKDAREAGIDRSGYMAPAVVNIPIATADEPLPAASLVYAQPATQTPGPGAAPNIGRAGGQVVIGMADRNQTRASGEPPEPVEGVTNPAEVGQAQIQANEDAKTALDQSVPDSNEADERDTRTKADLQAELDEQNIAWKSADTRDTLLARLNGTYTDE